MTDRNASNSQINTYAAESKTNAKLHQTYINNMNYNNTHKMECMIQNNKMIGRCFKLNDKYFTSLRPINGLDSKIDPSTKARHVKLKILNHQKRQRENHNELQGN